jgi:hypothetical protein
LSRLLLRECLSRLLLRLTREVRHRRWRQY